MHSVLIFGTIIATAVFAAELQERESSMSTRWEEYNEQRKLWQTELTTATTTYLTLQTVRFSIIIGVVTVFVWTMPTYRQLLLSSRTAVVVENMYLLAIPFALYFIAMYANFLQTQIASILMLVNARGLTLEQNLGIEEGFFIAARMIENPFQEAEYLMGLHHEIRTIFHLLYIVVFVLLSLAVLAVTKLVW